MAQTNMKSDAFCSYNQASSPFFWTMEGGQYENTYATGEVGLFATGGAAGSYVRPSVVDISSFLSGRDDMLSKCMPPVPDLDSLKEGPLAEQNAKNTTLLLPKFTKEKKSAVDISAVDYNRWQPLDTEPQDLRFVIEDMWAQRGGLDTQNYTKLAWKPGSYTYSPPDACRMNLDPARACGEYCESVSGFPGNSWLDNRKLSAVAKTAPKPPNEPSYPFVGPVSQSVQAVGAAACGPNFYYGPRLEQGGPCPLNETKMLEGTAISPSKFPLKVN